MKIERWVSNFELSKKIKALGVKQESYWYWVYNKVRDIWKVTILTQCFKDHPESWEYYSAFSVGELGEMLGEDGDSCYEANNKYSKWHCHNLRFWRNCEKFHNEYADTEADARAQLLIWLLENKMIKLNGEK